MANNYTRNQNPHCSFCGKDASQVMRLIAGPGVYICNECVDLCNGILDEEPMTEDSERKPAQGGKNRPAVKLMLPT